METNSICKWILEYISSRLQSYYCQREREKLLDVNLTYLNTPKFTDSYLIPCIN